MNLVDLKTNMLQLNLILCRDFINVILDILVMQVQLSTRVTLTEAIPSGLGEMIPSLGQF